MSRNAAICSFVAAHLCGDPLRNAHLLQRFERHLLQIRKVLQKSTDRLRFQCRWLQIGLVKLERLFRLWHVGVKHIELSRSNRIVEIRPRFVVTCNEDLARNLRVCYNTAASAPEWQGGISEEGCHAVEKVEDEMSPLRNDRIIDITQMKQGRVRPLLSVQIQISPSDECKRLIGSLGASRASHC